MAPPPGGWRPGHSCSAPPTVDAGGWAPRGCWKHGPSWMLEAGPLLEARTAQIVLGYMNRWTSPEPMFSVFWNWKVLKKWMFRAETVIWSVADRIWNLCRCLKQIIYFTSEISLFKFLNGVSLFLIPNMMFLRLPCFIGLRTWVLLWRLGIRGEQEGGGTFCKEINRNYKNDFYIDPHVRVQKKKLNIYTFIVYCMR